MGKSWRTVVIASLLAGAMTFLAAPVANAAPTPCTSVVQNIRINGDVEVPGGATCVLINVTVGGRLLVDPGGNLITQGAIVAGNLSATSPASIRLDVNPPSCSGTSCTQPTIVRGTAVIDGTTGVPS